MRAALILLVAASSACVFYPRAEYSDADCRTITRKLHLGSADLMGFSCSNGDPRACIAALAGAGIVSAGTAIVSGSIVLVNNSISWLEEKGRCGGTPPPATPPPTTPPPTETYPENARCRMIARAIEFDSSATLDANCARADPQSCFASLAALGVVHGSTATVSGSVVMLENKISWLEPRGRCDGNTPPR